MSFIFLNSITFASFNHFQNKQVTTFIWLLLVADDLDVDVAGKKIVVVFLHCVFRRTFFTVDHVNEAFFSKRSSVCLAEGTLLAMKMNE